MYKLKIIDKRIFLLLIVFAVGLILTYTVFDIYLFKTINERKSLENAKTIIYEKESSFKQFFVESDNTLYSILNNKYFQKYLLTNKNEDEMISMFLSISKSNSKIMQLRYLDENGLEKIRVDRKLEGSEPFIVQREDLQDKSNRYYFSDSKDMFYKNPSSKIWYSDLDLNIEHKKIERPLNPTIRAMLPVSYENKFRGVLIINFFMKNILKELLITKFYDVQLVDGDGKQLVGYDETRNWEKFLNSSSKKIDNELSKIFSTNSYTDENFVAKRLDIPSKNQLFLVFYTSQEHIMNKIFELKNYYAYLILAILIMAIIVSSVINHFFNKLGFELEKSQKLEMIFRSIFDQAGVAIAQSSIDGSLLRVNIKLLDLLGFTLDELKQLTFEDISLEDEYKEELKLRGKLLNNDLNSFTLEKHLIKKDGTNVLVKLSMSILYDYKMKKHSFISIIEDLQEVELNRTFVKKSIKTIEELSNLDQLTKLPNRASIHNDVSKIIKESTNGSKLALILLDIDNFKHFNSVYGHKIGDEIIKESVKRLKLIMKDNYSLGRNNGDEFLVMINGCKSQNGLEEFILNVRDIFKSPMVIQNHNINMTLSAGITIYPDDATDANSLFKHLDIAIYQAKQDGKNNYKYYSDAMSEYTKERIFIKEAIPAGLKNKEFEVYYQPQQDLNTNELIGLEALIRWKHPERGFIRPDHFIPISEESKQVIEIGEFVIDEVCKLLADYKKENIDIGRIAVNVSGIQLEYSDFIGYLGDKIKYYGILENTLEIEITESVIMKNIQKWIDTISKIRSLGVNISIDDFGTGYSSLSYLRKIPFNKLKIDKSFVDDTPSDPDACAIAETIINMSKNLKIKTIAEGIENNEQKEFFKNKGCDYLQGYLFAKPMDKVDLRKFVSKFIK